MLLVELNELVEATKNPPNFKARISSNEDEVLEKRLRGTSTYVVQRGGSGGNSLR